MKRKIINIDESKCNGCGLCANACHEGAIEIIDGKAKLTRDDFCDGFGDCLPQCPSGAITFTEREAEAYNEQAVREHKMEKQHAPGHQCPGSACMTLHSPSGRNSDEQQHTGSGGRIPYIQNSCLAQWPVQIKLVPIQARFYDNANLLVAADCCAYAFAGFHERFMKNHITLIGCPKLDGIDYTDKLSEIVRNNPVKSVTVVRMEVPCCGGLENAVKNALQASGKFIPWQIVTISRGGNILE